jgi:hypothetical protein
MNAIAYIWLTIDPAAVPSALHHRLTLRMLEPNGNRLDTIVATRHVEVHKVRPLVISPPFEGGTWAASNGPSNNSIDRRALSYFPT